MEREDAQRQNKYFLKRCVLTRWSSSVMVKGVVSTLAITVGLGCTIYVENFELSKSTASVDDVRWNKN